MFVVMVIGYCGKSTVIPQFYPHTNLPSMGNEYYPLPLELSDLRVKSCKYCLTPSIKRLLASNLAGSPHIWTASLVLSSSDSTNSLNTTSFSCWMSFATSDTVFSEAKSNNLSLSTRPTNQFLTILLIFLSKSVVRRAKHHKVIPVFLVKFSFNQCPLEPLRL